jgi:hypothetical protein
MPSGQLRGWLSARGWDMTAVADRCWLDCDGDGYRKTWADRRGTRWEICLCPQDALVLEEGAWGGDYSGAPTPGDSAAGEWPWLLLPEAG